MDEPITLEQLRERAGVTKRETARRMGMTHQNVMRIEEDGSAPIKTLEKYAAAINATFAEVAEAARTTYQVKLNYHIS